ncbi:serine hydrolase domain-containing protein [Paenibacillus ihuae]|uniref:serine hydrolase domain-containing protein n=1 Tax=Paenibacillus ihuae TaxID=1232431 RepID=UPI0006D5856B|nr:serine hydrolase [Paenibacillus ihuae]
MRIEQLRRAIASTAQSSGFSGTILVSGREQELILEAYGHANLADNRLNKPDTRFGIASGCKLFTAIAICQLVEQGKLSFESRALEVLKGGGLAFPLFSPEITVHQLLTHSSGIGDYFDEETMDDFAELWKAVPMYTLRRLEDFLPMFQNLPMKFNPGDRFHYNNAGYIMLGLLVEAASGMAFADYVEQHIFLPCGMQHSGYFALDNLPANTALGYIEQEDGSLITNIYSIPVKGGADGGAFITATDMQLLWDGLFNHRLLNEETTALLLTPHIHEDQDNYYGYGVWITKLNGEVYKYHVMGFDPGVSFRSAFYPASGVTFAALCNRSKGAYQIMQTVEDALGGVDTPGD